MEWISVRDRLPKTDEPVWIYWRDRDVVIGWYTLYGEERERKIQQDLQHEEWYSWEYEKCRWTNWWMPIGDKPSVPEEHGMDKR